MTLASPFIYQGGKRRWGADVWRRFGEVEVYAEPFCGTCAMLWAAPRVHKREIINDSNGYVCNFWRAIQRDPHTVARYADYPSYHQDLTARHRWLIEWGRANAQRLSEDMDWYDAKAAGLWCWGINLWIAIASWCADTAPSDTVPGISDTGPTGVTAQRQTYPDGIPMIGGQEPGYGRGVMTQRKTWPDTRPHLQDKGGIGVQPQRASFGNAPIGDGHRLFDWFDALAQRLSRVYTLNRDWTSVVTDTLLQHTPKASHPECAVFLDPPYLTNERAELYHSDLAGTSDDVAVAAYEWAVAHGEQYRIAYCCHADDFPLPDGWTSLERSFGKAREGAKDQIMFSPRCLTAEQGRLI